MATKEFGATKIEIPSQQAFNYLLFVTINDVLEKALGNQSKDLILKTIEKKYSMKRTDIPRKTQVLAECLHEILGVDATIIEELILETFYSQLNQEFKCKKNYQFSDYIIELKKEVEKTV